MSTEFKEITSLEMKDVSEQNAKNNYVKELEKLAEIFSLDVKDIPDCIKQDTKYILKIIEKACVDDPVLIIDWTDPFPRTGRGQTKCALINHIVNHGGANEFASNMIFSFKSGRQLAQCMGGFPDWSRHDRNNPHILDVGHCYRANKVDECSADLEDYQLVFNI